MRVILTEQQFSNYILSELSTALDDSDKYNPTADGNLVHNPYRKQIEINNQVLDKYLHTFGKSMVSIENGREYKVIEISQLADLTGKRFCICQLIKDKKPYGAIYIKPFFSFRVKN